MFLGTSTTLKINKVKCEVISYGFFRVMNN